MAKSKEDIEKELKALRENLDKADKVIFDRILKNLQSGSASLEEWNSALDLFKTKINSISDDLDYISTSFNNSISSLARGNSQLNKQLAALRKLRSISDELLSMRRGDLNYDLKKIKKLEEQAKKSYRILQSQLQQLQTQNQTDAKLVDQLEKAKLLLEQFEALKKEARQFEKSIGLTGTLLKGLSKIPILGDLLGVQEALEAANEAARDGAGRWKTLGAAMKSVGGNLLDSLNDPLVVGGLLITAFKTIKDLLLSADTTAGNLAKGMNMTYTASLNTLKQLDKINGNSLATAKDYSETLNFIGDQLGSNAFLNEKDLETFTKLRIEAGLTNEELMGAQKLSLANGMSLEDNVNTIMNTTSALNRQRGIYLNEKTILKDIGKISAATTLTLNKDVKALTKAVVTAKALGMEMSKLEQMSSSLLNFEQSIEDELSAELLTGKDLNLERARLLALNGDIAGLAEEINSQIGSSADFTKMNVIQQEALAKAVGMNREELAQTLFTQEQLKGLNKDEAARRQAILDQRIEEVGLAQAQRELEAGGIKNLEQQASVQDKINQLIDKVKEKFAMEFIPYLETVYHYFQSIVEEAGGMDKFVQGIKDKISGMVTFVKEFFKIWVAIKAAQIAYNATAAIGLGIQQRKAAAAAAEAGAEITSSSMKSLGWQPIVGVGLAVAAALAAYATLSSIMNDGIIPPAGGAGYGKRVLYGPEGSIQLNNKDTIIAGTNLFGNDVKSEPNKPTQMGNAGAIKVQSTGGGDMSAVIEAINSLANRPINVSIDGKKVIEATIGAQPNTTGDENRKNSYRIS
jgi:hypothetical protein